MKSKNTSSSSRASNRKSQTSKETLQAIFIDLLRDMYWAEKYLIKSLPKMAKAAYHEELKETIESHLEETKLQVTRLEKCFTTLELKQSAKKCEAMEGLVEEGIEVIENHGEGHARDAGLIAAAQKIEHYEISSYGTMQAMASLLGMMQCAELLKETKEEEVEADEKLTELSNKINRLAVEIEEEETEEQEVA